jgi:hypothetical protein
MIRIGVTKNDARLGTRSPFQSRQAFSEQRGAHDP